MRALVLVALIGLCIGCTRTVYIDRISEVKVPIPVPCVKAEDIPQPMIYKVDQLDSDATDGEIILALFSERAQRKNMQSVLINLISACYFDLP